MENTMNEKRMLRQIIETLNTGFVFEDEIYVMNYLKALEKKVLLFDHPLSVQYHIPPQQAYQTLIHKSHLTELAQQFGCHPSQTFTQLRLLLDQWDGVSLPESYEARELNENDAYTLLLDDNAMAKAGNLLGVTALGVLGYLFDPLLVERDFRRAFPTARQLNGVYQWLRYLSQSASGQKQMKQMLGINSTWEILERWLKADVRTELASQFSESGKPVSRTQALQELFRRVKVAIGTKTLRTDKWQNSLRQTTFGQLMPSRSKQFWEDLEHISAKTTKKIALDALDEANLDIKRAEDNATKALEIAEQFITEQISPLEKELARVDIFGMMALNHRFYGVLDAMLGNALHYSSLDTEDMSLVSLIQHAIRYYGYGEFQLALSRLLLTEKLPLGQFGLKTRLTNSGLNGPDETKLLYFSSEDSSNRLQAIGSLFRQTRSSAPQPPRQVEKDELLVAVLDSSSSRTVEIVCFYNLEKEQILHLRQNSPSTVAELSRVGITLVDRLLNTYLPVLPERKRINASLSSALVDLTRCAVFSGERLPDCGLFSAPDLFGKTIPFTIGSTTLVWEITAQALGDDIVNSYIKDGVSVNRSVGL